MITKYYLLLINVILLIDIVIDCLTKFLSKVLYFKVHLFLYTD